MKQIYLLSGLGADKRAFQYLDLSNYDPIYIHWIKPTEKENIEKYANRLLDQITTPRPILVGLSFGGLIAIEMAKLIKTEAVILIASVKSRKEIPFYYRLAGIVNLHKLLPLKLLTKPSALTNWFFGVKTMDDKKLLAEIMRDTDLNFLKWAINQLVKWPSQHNLQNLKHVHGTADRIFPLRFIQADYPIAKGGHFMTVNKFQEVSSILQKLI
jgi:pimeloyl-ACP methyl ester carboxylesterase